MKKCEPFKDLILTDYVDGQLDKDITNKLESHLLDCPDCRAFLKEVKANAVIPLAKAPYQPVPAELWDAIRQSIESRDRHEFFLLSLYKKVVPVTTFLKGLFVFPRLVPVFASLIVMLLAGSVELNTIQVQQAQAKEQGEYLVSLLSPSAQGDNSDPGTPIEHYFL